MRKLFKRLRELHSYSVPEFLTLAPLESNPDYEHWANQEAKPKPKSKRGRK